MQQPILTITDLDFCVSKAARSEGYFTVAEITKQLKWHKLYGVKDAVPTVENQWGTKREHKIQLLHSTIEKFIEAKASVPGSMEGFEEVEEDPEVTAQDLQAFDSDGYNCEEDYCK